MSPYGCYSLKSLSYLVTAQSDSYSEYLLVGALFLCDTFGYSNVFFQQLLSKKRCLNAKYNIITWNLELKTQELRKATTWLK